MDASRLHTKEGWLEERLGTPEPFVANGDDLTIRKLVALLQGGGCGSSGHLKIEVQSNIAEFFLDISDDFSLGSCDKGIPTLGEDLHEIVGEVPACHIKTENGVGESVTLVDGDCVGDTITRIEHNTGGTTRRVERQHGLDGNVHGWRVEGFKHDLGHPLPVGLGVEWGLCEQDRVLLWCNTQLVVEGVVPYFLHVVPVGDDAVFNGVLEGKDTSLGLSLIAHIAVFLTHSNHHTLENKIFSFVEYLIF